MRLLGGITRVALVLSALFFSAVSAEATTSIRQGLERLATESQDVLLGRVVEIHSYWNQDHTRIFTDVRIRPTRILKGDPSRELIVITEVGGTVGDVTTLIVGGPELVPGSDYLLFLNRGDLPGVRGALSVGSLNQGAFDIVDSPRGRRAVSQATRHSLLPDATGVDQPPGGVEGLSLDDALQQIQRIVGGR